MRKTLKLTSGMAVAFVAGMGVAVAGNAPGVTDTEIKIGNTNPYSGPASVYSTIGKSIGACWKQVNAEGGINGRKINWISYDDGYSPPKTKEQIRRLVEKDKVALTFQTLGTPTNSAIHKYMNKKKVPHLFVATGATKWGQPKKFPWTMGFQPNYQTIGRIFGNYILQNLLQMRHHNFFTGTQWPQMDYQLPLGVAFELPANTGFDLNSHYVNRTNKPLKGEVFVNLHYQKRDAIEHIAKIIDFNHTDFDLPPGQVTTLTKDFYFHEQAQVFQLFSHAHELMTEFRVVLSVVIEMAKRSTLLTIGNIHPSCHINHH